ncbi:MAG: glycosyltransferase, partial [Akkermansiaceae bacterium]|nr:glycosyltransferase [Verrucomicrobiales bacterium]
MNTEQTSGVESGSGPCISIGIIAWNEERAIQTLLESVFRQTLFAELRKRNLRCEILCVANGCSDRTTQVAEEIFLNQSATHPDAQAFSGRAIALQERGKINAWNQFVHSLSAREAKFLFLMDADILIRNPETLFSMWQTLVNCPEARIAVDVPRKDLEFKSSRGWRDRMSLTASKLTRSSAAQLCAQLYCIRSETARNIYLPKDLTACDDGFIKTMVCTDFLAHAVWPTRIQVARNASHTFEAYTSLSSLFKNQKRQAIGQTIVHLLVDEHLNRLPIWERSKLAETLRKKDEENPDWLKRLVHEHLRRKRFFWR